MNERIRELALEAVVERASGFREFDANVFAELIIKECASLCNNFDVYYADNSPLKREVALETAHDLSDMILEHFGIEE